MPVKKSLLFKSTIILIIMATFLAGYFFRDQVSLYTRQLLAYYYVYKADQEYKKERFDNAIEGYSYALQLYPGHSKAQYNLGNIQAALEDYYSAMDSYEKTLNIQPNYINARINLGLILSEQLHDIDRAINEYTNAANSEPMLFKIPFIFDNSKKIKASRAVAYYNLGLAYRAKALLYSYDPLNERAYLFSAADSYRKSLEIQPDNYDARYNLALTLHLLKNYSEALQEYCKAIKLSPTNYDAHYNMALLLKQTGRYQDALTELEKAGLVLGIEGNAEKTLYIYQILSDVRQKAATKNKKQTDNSKKPEACGMESCEICTSFVIQE